MDISKLESFLVLAREKNFAKASDLLYISQPALSKRIQSLEEELRVPLFNRIGKQSFLTMQGEYFKKFAEETVASYYNTQEYIRQIDNLEDGTLNFGATNFIGVYLIPEVIGAFHRRFPNIELNMTIDTSHSILEMLHKNQVEFVLLSDYILKDVGCYVAETFYEDRLKLIVGRDHRLFGRERCSLRDVADDLYITKKMNASQFRFLTKRFDECGFDFKNKLFISNQEAIKESVVYNVGISIMSDKAAEREVRAGLISALEIEEMEIRREIQYVFLKNKFLTPAAKQMIRMLQGAGCRD